MDAKKKKKKSGGAHFPVHSPDRGHYHIPRNGGILEVARSAVELAHRKAKNQGDRLNRCIRRRRPAAACQPDQHWRHVADQLGSYLPHGQDFGWQPRERRPTRRSIGRL